VDFTVPGTAAQRMEGTFGGIYEYVEIKRLRE
jgi:hypothetical protein